MSKPYQTLKIGIMPLEQYKQRTIAIAKGEYAPKVDEPKIWFESIKSMAQILSTEKQELRKVIVKDHMYRYHKNLPRQ